MVMILSGVWGCVKDERLSDEVVQFQNRSEPSNTEKFTTKIQDFIEIMKGERSSSSFRSVKVYAGTEAMQAVENAMNYTYGWANVEYSDYNVFKDTVIVAKTGTTLDETEVQILYDAVLNQLSCHYDVTHFNNKHIKVVDLYIISESSTVISVGVINVIGQVVAGPSNPPSLWSFGFGDDWWAIAGSCTSPNDGTDGAAPRIGVKVSHNYQLWHPLDPGYYSNVETKFHYFSDPFTFGYIGWGLDCGDSFLCVGGSCDNYGYDYFCIDNNEGNAYVSDYGDFVSSYASGINKDFINCNLTASIYLGDCSTYAWDDGISGTQYGVWNSKGVNPPPSEDPSSGCY